MAKKYKGKSLNYNFEDQKEPKKRMGKGDFANMPSDPKFLKFDNTPEYRGGNVNSFVCNVEEISEIYENQRSD